MRGEINLLPVEYKKKPVANREQIYLAVLILLALFYMVYYGVGVAGVERANLNQALKDANTELVALTEVSGKYDMKLAQEQVLSTNKQLAEKLAKEVQPLTPVLIEVNRLIPAGISLSESATGDNNTLLLKGTSPSMEKIADLLDTLNQSQYFADAKALDIRKNQNRAGFAFEVGCSWSKGGGQQ